MKILYYATAYHAAHGGSVHAHAFVEECGKSDLVSDIAVYPPTGVGGSSPAPSGLRRVLKANAVAQVFLFWRRNRFHLTGLKEFIRAFQPDVLHVRLDSNFLQLEAIRTWFPKLVITTEVNASPFDEAFRSIVFKSLFRRMEAVRLERTDLNFFVSNTLRKNIMGNRVEEGRDLVVQNGVDMSRFTKQSRPTTAGVVIVYVGTIDEHKQIGLLLRGFARACESIRELRLLVVGDGPSRTGAIQLAADLNLRDRVIFTGWASHTDVPKHLAEAHIAVHHKANPYMSPIKLFEYMAVGLPVIGPDIPAVREVFADGENIILTDGSPDDLAGKILLMTSDAELRNRVAASGYNLVSTRYTWQANVDFILKKMLLKMAERRAAS